MALVKLELLPLPDLREIGERRWFKIKLDSKAKWRPDGWLDPARDEDIQPALQDSTLTSLDDRIKHLSEITGRGEYECGTALREGKWRSSDNRYVSIATADFPQASQGTGPFFEPSVLVYRNRLVKATGDEPFDELSLRIRHKVSSHGKALDSPGAINGGRVSRKTSDNPAQSCWATNWSDGRGFSNLLNPLNPLSSDSSRRAQC